MFHQVYANFCDASLVELWGKAQGKGFHLNYIEHKIMADLAPVTIRLVSWLKEGIYVFLTVVNKRSTDAHFLKFSDVPFLRTEVL